MDTNLVLISTNDLAGAVNSLASAPDIQIAFNQGLTFGFGVVAFCLVLAMFRTIPGDDKEEM